MSRIVRRLAAALAAAVAVPVTLVALGTGAAQADIIVAPPPPELVCERSIAISDRRTYEGSYSSNTWQFPTLFAFTVTSSGCNRGGTVHYQTLHSTTNSYDYAATSGTLTFASADGASKTINVWVSRDGSPGQDERFWVKLSGASEDITVSDGWGLGTILNDDNVCTAPPDLEPGHDWHCME